MWLYMLLYIHWYITLLYYATTVLVTLLYRYLSYKYILILSIIISRQSGQCVNLLPAPVPVLLLGALLLPVLPLPPPICWEQSVHKHRCLQGSSTIDFSCSLQITHIRCSLCLVMQFLTRFVCGNIPYSNTVNSTYKYNVKITNTSTIH